MTGSTSSSSTRGWQVAAGVTGRARPARPRHAGDSRLRDRPASVLASAVEPIAGPPAEIRRTSGPSSVSTDARRSASMPRQLARTSRPSRRRSSLGHRRAALRPSSTEFCDDPSSPAERLLDATWPTLRGLQRQVAGRRGDRSGVLVGGDRALGDAHLVDLVGTVGEAGPARLLEHLAERRVR